MKDEEINLSKVKSDGKQLFPYGHRPELDQSAELIPEIASCYIQLIGILRWAMNLGRIEIFTEVALMPQYSASPQLGHFEGLYHMFEYLKKH